MGVLELLAPLCGGLTSLCSIDAAADDPEDHRAGEEGDQVADERVVHFCVCPLLCLCCVSAQELDRLGDGEILAHPRGVANVDLLPLVPAAGEGELRREAERDDEGIVVGDFVLLGVLHGPTLHQLRSDCTWEGPLLAAPPRASNLDEAGLLTLGLSGGLGRGATVPGALLRHLVDEARGGDGGDLEGRAQLDEDEGCGGADGGGIDRGHQLLRLGDELAGALGAAGDVHGGGSEGERVVLHGPNIPQLWVRCTTWWKLFQPLRATRALMREGRRAKTSRRLCSSAPSQLSQAS